MEKCNHCGGDLKEVNASLRFYDPVLVCSSCLKEHICPVIQAADKSNQEEQLELDWATEDFSDLLDLPKGSVNCIWNYGDLPELVELRHYTGGMLYYYIPAKEAVGFPADYAYLASNTMPNHLKVHLYGVE